MLNFISLSTLLAVAYFNGQSSAASDGSCPGGYSDGQDIVEGIYWYRCVQGTRVPQGCVSDSGDHVPVGSSFIHQDSQVVCQTGSDGFLSAGYSQSGCAQGGATKAVGDTWTDGSSLLGCMQDGSTAHVVTVGCIDDGTPAKFGDKKAKGDYVFQCNKDSSGTPTMAKVGCVNQGTNYNIGQTFSGGQYWYTCTDKGADVSGCVHSGQQLKDGDHINDGDAAYVCKVTGNGASMEPFACLGEDGVASVDRRVGCYWNEGGSVYTCKDVGGGKLAKVKVSKR